MGLCCRIVCSGWRRVFAIFFTVLFWENHRLLVLGIFTVLFSVAAGVAIFMTLRLSRQGSQMFAASLAELRRDEAALNPAKDKGLDVPS